MTLDVITAEALKDTRHGFFTRKGGASSGVFEGLNCGTGSTDQAEAISINRERVADWMGVESSELAGVHQIHSAEVVTIDAATPDKPKADGLVTATPGLALSILTADCLPVLFAAPGVIGAAHAGWKGAKAGILGNVVAAMEALGADRTRITAAIGPGISQTHYEVGPEFRDGFLADDPASDRFFIAGEDDRFHFDLPAYGMAALKQAGVGQSVWTGDCTYADPQRFFSYRRSVHRKEVDYGRLIAAIRL